MIIFQSGAVEYNVIGVYQWILPKMLALRNHLLPSYVMKRTCDHEASISNDTVAVTAPRSIHAHEFWLHIFIGYLQPSIYHITNLNHEQTHINMTTTHFQ